MLLMLLASVSALYCNYEFCPYYSLGDGTCSPACNIAPCRFDSAFSYSDDPSSIIQRSDCYYTCLKTCTNELLANGVCDSVCNTPECGYDTGTCSYCSSGCMEIMLSDGQCQSECNVPECYFDGGDCECSTGCTQDMIWNNVCDPECDNKRCSYDNWVCACNYGCTNELLSNGVCDNQCYTYSCLFDNGVCECAKGCTYDKLINEVCDPECNTDSCSKDNFGCTCADGCTKSKLLNSVCDEECNTKNCSYDYHNCQCSPGCLWEDYQDEVCDEACNTDNCQQDGGDCGCAPGCSLSFIGDGICQVDCYNDDCEFDEGDCDHMNCASGCTPSMSSNSVCDDQCNNAACEYDFQICLCSLGCTPEMLLNDDCEFNCNNKRCAFDREICGVCAVGCFNENYGDGNCDFECNVASCDYDFTDCCKPECELGTCSVECLYSECEYDSSCSDTFLQDAAKYRQLLGKDFNLPLDLEICYEAEPDCTEADLRLFYSGLGTSDSCTSDACFRQFGQDECCSKDLHCDRCIGSKCLECEEGYLHLYTECVLFCPPGYKVHSKISNLCYPLSDNTSEESPDIIFISEVASDKKNYRQSLIKTLAEVRNSYTLIYLTDTQTDLSALSEEDMEYFRLKNVYSPFERTFDLRLQHLTIRSHLCSQKINDDCLESPSRIMIRDILVTLVAENFHLTFKSVIIDGVQSFRRDCTGGFCSYCPYFSEVNYGTETFYFDDKENSYSEKPDVGCDPAAYTKSFIEVGCDGKLTLESSSVVDCRQGYKGFIHSEGALSLEDVAFNNIQGSGLSIDGFITQDCSSCSSQKEGCCFSFKYGSVKLLNNGYEYTDSISQSGFYIGISTEDVSIVKVTFASNIVLKPVTSNTSKALQHLLYFKQTKKPIIIQNCDFRESYISGSFIYADFSNLIYPQVLETYGALAETQWIHLDISKNTFKQVTADGILAVYMTKQMVNVRVSKLSVTDSLMFGDMIAVEHSYRPSMLDIQGGWNLFDLKGGKRELYLNPRSFQLNACTFTTTYWEGYAIKLTKLTNITIGRSTFRSVGTNSSTEVKKITESILANSDVYLSTSSTLPTSKVSCSGNIYMESCTKGSLYRIQLTSFDCGGSVGATVSGHAESLYLSRFTVETVSSRNKNGGLFSLHSMSDASIQASNITVSGLINPIGGGAFYIEQSSFTLFYFSITDSTTALDTGLFLSSMRNVTISYSSFTRLTSESGFSAGMQITFDSAENNPALEVTYCKFFECKASAFSGGGVFVSYSIYPLHFLISNCEFTENLSRTEGSSIMVSGTVNFFEGALIDSCLFQSNHDGASGTLSVMLSGSKLTVENCKFLRHRDVMSVVSLSLLSSSSQFVMKNCSLYDNSGNSVISMLGQQPGGTFEMHRLEVEKNLVQYSLNLNKGVIVMKECTFAFNSGPITFTLISANITDTKFYKNTVEGPAGAVDLYESSVFACKRCDFIENQALSAGAIRVDSKSLIHISQSTFELNSAKDSGSVLYMINSRVNNLILSSKIQSNSVSVSGTILMIESKLALDKVVFSLNTNPIGSPGVVTQSSTLEVTDSTFSNQVARSNAFFSLTASSVGTFTRSKFINGRVTFSGGLGEILNSIGSFKVCSFLNITSGIGAMITSSETDLVFDGCSASFLKTTGTGSFVDVRTGSLAITNTVVTDFNQTAVSTSDTETIEVIESGFYRGFSYSETVFSVQNFKTFSLMRSNFNSNFANTTAAVVSAFTLLNWPDNSSLVISNCTFANNSAASAAAVKTDVKMVSISKSLFVNNTARVGSGGAIELDCEVFSQCDLSISNSTFRDNRAKVNGGAIYWTKNEPNLIHNIYEGNYAVYGPNVACFGVNLKGVDFELPSVSATPLSKVSGSTYLNIVSGQRLPMTIAISLVDHYGQVITTDNTSIGTISPVNTGNVTVTGEARVQAIAGIYYFSNVKFSANPGQTITLKVISDSLQNLASDASGENGLDYIEFSAELRQCIAGEALIGKDCVICQYGTYSLDPSQVCTSCPSGATCYGGALMSANQGYWRLHPKSDQFFKCPNPLACVGSDHIVLSLTGNCLAGYRGNKCQPCDNGYSRKGENECAICPNSRDNALIIIGICFATILGVAFLVRSSLRTAYEPTQLHSVYIKIFANYLQLIVITTQLNLDWPSFVYQLFKTQKSAASITDQIFSYDCLLDDGSENAYVNVYFKKLMIIGFIPFICSGVTVVFWLMHYLYWGKKQVLQKELVASLIILFFLLHSSLVKANFAMFSCSEITTGELWLTDNLDIRCYGETHSYYALTVALPALLLWGVSVPSLLLLHLYRKRHSLSNLPMKLKFGFLYTGFRSSKYYWEFVIMYRKIVIISSVVFIGNFSVKIQALTIMLVIAVFVWLQHIIQPYNSVNLNQMEMRAILVAAVTVYCGLYYLTDDLDPLTKIFVFVLMVYVNIHFNLYFFKRLGISVFNILLKYILCLRKCLGKEPTNPYPAFNNRSSPLAEKAMVREAEMVYSYVKPVTTPARYLNSKLTVKDMYLQVCDYQIGPSQADTTIKTPLHLSAFPLEEAPQMHFSTEIFSESDLSSDSCLKPDNF